MSLVSVVIPAYRAENTLPRAARSLLSQTAADWEAIVVSDDGADYQNVLRDAGIGDERFRFVSTGKVGSGCHNARNCGLAAARGEFIAALDADDLFLPGNLERLVPLAEKHGAVVGNTAVIADANGTLLYRAFETAGSVQQIDSAAVLALSLPLFPLVRHELAEPRLGGVEFAEDVVANLRLLDRIGTMPALTETLFEYRVVTGSLSHGEQSAARFEESYSALIDRLTAGDRLGLSSRTAEIARNGFIRKRDFNRAYTAARATEPHLDFQTFAARQRR